MEKGPPVDGKQAGVGTSRRCKVRKTPRVDVRATGTGSLSLSARQTTKFMAVLAQSSVLIFSGSVGTLELGKQGSKCQAKGPTPSDKSSQL